MDKNKSKIALKKAKSLIEKVLKMIDEDKYCIDIIQQNLAIIGLIKSANLGLLEQHLNCCVKSAARLKNEKALDKKMQELLNVIKVAQNK